MAGQPGVVQRLRGFPSPDVLLNMLMLHVARGYLLRETEPWQSSVGLHVNRTLQFLSRPCRSPKCHPA